MPLSVTSGVTGTGGLVLQNNSATDGGVTLTTTSVNNVGTITNSGTGTGSTTITAVIGSSVTSVIENSATSALVLSGANTYAGGLKIKQGTVIANVSNATTVSGAAGPSTSAITLGDSAGGSASLLANSFTVSNAVNLGSSAVGTLTIGNNGGVTAAVFSGAIGLNGRNLTIASNGTGSTTVSGGITGTGSLTIANGSTTATTTI
jgi:autotransporter-associated beta strand protein